MIVLLTGATGFVGSGVLQETLLASEVAEVLVLGRKSCGVSHAKLTEIVIPDFENLSKIEYDLARIDACFWCLGVSSIGMKRQEYDRITRGYTMTVAKALQQANPRLHFSFVSGSGADGKAMWAQVKKSAEVGLQQLGLPSIAIFRPAYIQATHPAKLRGALYQASYRVATWFAPLIRGLGGGTSNGEIGKAMLVCARDLPKYVLLDSKGINRTAGKLQS